MNNKGLIILGTMCYLHNQLNFANPTPPIQQAKSYQQQEINIEEYWISEKLDGVRGYWTGTTILTKKGYDLSPPDWFVKHWPAQKMDGELWIAREQYETTLSCVMKILPNNNCWESITFMIFDLPTSKAPFSTRIILMKSIAHQTESNFLQVIPQYQLSSIKQLNKHLKAVIKNKGEGLMLHKADALYTKGRTANILKVKQKYDAEATVLEHIEGKGKYQHLLGAIKVINDEDIVFKIGTGFSDQERHNPPPIGSRITYQYLGKTKNNVPRFASFLRIRLSEH